MITGYSLYGEVLPMPTRLETPKRQQLYIQTLRPTSHAVGGISPYLSKNYSDEFTTLRNGSFYPFKLQETPFHFRHY